MKRTLQEISGIDNHDNCKWKYFDAFNAEGQVMEITKQSLSPGNSGEEGSVHLLR